MTIALIPTIFIIAVIIGVVATGPLLTRRFSLRANAMLIIGYLAILVVMSVSVYTLPSKTLKSPVGPDFIINFEQSSQAIAAGVHDGSFSAPEGCHKTATTFDVTAGHIEISAARDLPGLVFAGTKGIDTPDDGRNKISVYIYNETYINHNNSFYDIPLAPPTVSFDNAVLSVINPAEETIRLISFNDKNTLPQFFDVSDFYGGMHSSLVVVVLLPPDVS
ncbi:MAG: hypothetical protein GX847_00715, partial [Clostridiales bacterium]|nr:hypothetical protein [Clostridiales bacterium]